MSATIGNSLYRTTRERDRDWGRHCNWLIPPWTTFDPQLSEAEQLEASQTIYISKVLEALHLSGVDTSQCSLGKLIKYSRELYFWIDDEGHIQKPKENLAPPWGPQDE